MELLQKIKIKKIEDCFDKDIEIFKNKLTSEKIFGKEHIVSYITTITKIVDNEYLDTTIFKIVGFDWFLYENWIE